MNEQDKELLFIDLSNRLPYRVKVHCECASLTLIGDIITLDIRAFDKFFNKETEYVPYDVLKPYLFPLSSMTEEQKIECFKGTDIELDEHNEIWSTFPISNSDIVLTNLNNWLKVINWLIKNHFDYRGLIEKGLAIDATNLNIY